MGGRPGRPSVRARLVRASASGWQAYERSASPSSDRARAGFPRPAIHRLWSRTVAHHVPSGYHDPSCSRDGASPRSTNSSVHRQRRSRAMSSTASSTTVKSETGRSALETSVPVAAARASAIRAWSKASLRDRRRGSTTRYSFSPDGPSAMYQKDSPSGSHRGRTDPLRTSAGQLCSSRDSARR